MLNDCKPLNFVFDESCWAYSSKQNTLILKYLI